MVRCLLTTLSDPFSLLKIGSDSCSCRLSIISLILCAASIAGDLTADADEDGILAVMVLVLVPVPVGKPESKLELGVGNPPKPSRSGRLSMSYESGPKKSPVWTTFCGVDVAVDDPVWRMRVSSGESSADGERMRLEGARVEWSSGGVEQADEGVSSL